MGFSLFWLVLGANALRAAPSKEYRIKAAFLYNFTKFIEWPPRHFATDSQPIVIGVVGRNPFDSELEDLVRGRKVNGREIVVKVFESGAGAETADLLFIGVGAEPLLDELIEKLRTRAVLTVGESSRFTALGGTITFTVEREKVRFEIDEAAAKRGGVKLSAQLLKLAASVRR